MTERFSMTKCRYQDLKGWIWSGTEINRYEFVFERVSMALLVRHCRLRLLISAFM